MCSRCCCYKSPIPYLGKQSRVRVCKSCVQNYSNCPSTFTKNVYSRQLQAKNIIPYYAQFAESKNCGDLYVWYKQFSIIDRTTPYLCMSEMEFGLISLSVQVNFILLLSGFLTNWFMNVNIALIPFPFSLESIIVDFVGGWYAQIAVRIEW